MVCTFTVPAYITLRLTFTLAGLFFAFPPSITALALYTPGLNEFTALDMPSFMFEGVMPDALLRLIHSAPGLAVHKRLPPEDVIAILPDG